MSDSQIPTQEQLLQHDGWMRDLAQRLVADTQSADDLVQETWLAALTHGLPGEKGVRGWLARVLRNQALQRRRGEANRRARERDSARPESSVRVQDYELRALHRQLVDALDELGEPYRATLVMLYFSGLAPSRVADLQNVSVKTVYSRNERGLERLRAALDARYGGERNLWTVGLLALLVPRAGVGRLQSWTAGIALGAIALTLIAIGLGSDTPPAETAAALDARGSAAGAPRSDGVAASQAPESARTPASTALGASVPRAPTPAATIVAATTATAPVLGRVLDPAGNALAGMEVYLEEGEVATSATGLGFARLGTRGPIVLATTGPDGSFRIEGEDPELIGRLGARSDAYTTALHSMRWREHRSAVIVAAPRQPLSGRARTRAGDLVAGATIDLRLPPDFGTSLPLGLGVKDSATTDYLSAVSDSRGYFALPDAFRVEGARLEVSAPGFGTTTVLLTRDAAAFLDLVLGPGSQGELVGRVFTADLEPAAGALVGLGKETGTTGPDGAFTLPAPPSLADPVLYATRKGHLPASVRPELDAGGNHVWPDPLELVLGGTPRTIIGTVVDSAGEPVQDALVWLMDPTYFVHGTMPLHLELASDPLSVEYWPNWRTDRLGRFRLGGLLERDYRICALDKDRLVTSEPLTVRAGTDGLRLVLDLDDVYPRVRGRALTQDGRPLAGARVGGVAPVLVVALPGNPRPFSLFAKLPTQVTDADGSFDLPPLSRSAWLRVLDDEACSQAFDQHDAPLDPGVVSGAFEIRVPQRAWLRVEHPRATELAVVGADGLTLPLHFADQPYRDAEHRASLVDGRSSELVVTEGPTTLVLYEGGRELERRALLLVGGERHHVR